MVVREASVAGGNGRRPRGWSRGRFVCGRSEAVWRWLRAYQAGWLNRVSASRESVTRCLGQDADQGHEQEGDEEFHAAYPAPRG